ncbi:MAG: mechanosensitive ion channel [Phycisphaerae bacterium]|nr:mechanosensitive ion channel [Phycisphaerae bacterium]MCZ2401099.1 mechanosensitive ion channel [Phycisphaerae bacterium]NUQ49631.1 mechanosensitive ion channel [Phycisphaerae bacterium]
MNARWSAWSGLCLTLAAVAVSAASLAQPPPNPPAQTSEDAQKARDSDKPAAEPSVAERIARLQRSVDETAAQLKELKTRLEDPKSEFAVANEEFAALDKQLDARKRELQAQLEAGQVELAAATQKEIDALLPRHALAKERFDNAIRERRAVSEQVATLEAKLQADQLALQRLKGETPPPTTQPAAPQPEPPVAPTAKPEPVPAQAPPAATPQQPGAMAAPTPQPVPAPSSPATTEATPELVRAREAAAQKQEAMREAEEEAQSVRDRLAVVQKSLEGEQKLYEAARNRVANAQQTERSLYEEERAKIEANVPRVELRELRAKIAEARQRFQDAQKEVLERADRIDRLQDEIAALQRELLTAADVAEQRRREAEAARRDVEHLQNPWTITNVLNWIIARGPRIVGIVLGVIVLLWVVRLVESRFVKLLAGRADHGSYADRQNRARTLVGVFNSAANVTIYGGGAMMLLTEFGLNVVPLMGGAAVLGLAVAFGAQNLIRDYFYGFMILLENQYAVNDVIRIGEVSGQVEKITLRITMLRGLDGSVHFIPNGEIKRVSNMTHGWSRALFDIPVAYKEDVDRVMEVLMDLAKELRRDPNYRSLILEMPEMLGVNQFADSAVVIRFFMKTRPLQQWAVQRELLRRIKNRFDELGIEIPFPHRTVFHRNGGPPGQMALAADDATETPDDQRADEPRVPRERQRMT